jgi:hypothetical protein
MSLRIALVTVIVAGCGTDGAWDEDSGSIEINDNLEDRARFPRHTATEWVDCSGSDGNICIECNEGGTLACCMGPLRDCYILGTTSAQASMHSP